MSMGCTAGQNKYEVYLLVEEIKMKQVMIKLYNCKLRKVL